MNINKKSDKFIFLLLITLYLVIFVQPLNAGIVEETSSVRFKIFYYVAENPAIENITFCDCQGSCNPNSWDWFLEEGLPDLVPFGYDDCIFSSDTACKLEGQYYAGIATDVRPPGPDDCSTLNPCGPYNSRMLYNVTAHYVNYDESQAHCENSFPDGTVCGNGTWDPDAPDSYDIYPPGVVGGLLNGGSCCGDDLNDEPDMGKTACENCQVGYNVRPTTTSPKFRRWKSNSFAAIPGEIGCCGDDMIEDCMLFAPTVLSEYVCVDAGGIRTSQIREPIPPAIDCLPIPDCNIPALNPSGKDCCESGTTVQDPASSQQPPYNTSNSYWNWWDSGDPNINGLILNVTCANYQILASDTGWVSCNNFIINRDVTFSKLPNVNYRVVDKEKYFSIFDGDGGQPNPLIVFDPTTGMGHSYYCYSEEGGNYTISECCGGNSLNNPIQKCLADKYIGGTPKITGDYLTKVKNHDLEDGAGTNAYFWTEGLSHEWSGNFMRFYNNTPSDSFTFSDSIQVRSNQNYVITALVYNSLNSGKAGIEVCKPDYSWCTCQTNSLIGLQRWEKLSCSFTTPGSVTSLAVKLFTNGGATGEARFDDVRLNTYYCAEDYSFTTDLDSKPEESCDNAGHEYTGQYCCSEDDDANEYYNDLGGDGACWNKVYQSNGAFWVKYPEGGNEILEVAVNNGSFYGCAIDNTNPSFNPAGDSNKPYEGSINFVRNPDFEIGSSLSPFYQAYGSPFAYISNEWLPHQKVLKIDYNAPGDYVSQKGIPLQNGFTYTITFEAKTNLNATIAAYDILKDESGTGIINCGPFQIEEDRWKSFKCSGIWTSNQLAEIVLETTKDPANEIFYDNLRIYSSNDYLLTLNDKPNPGENWPNKGQLIADKTYCEGFDLNSDGTDDFFCSYLEKWEETFGQNRTTLSTIPWVPDDSSTQMAECCSEDSCWNGTVCVWNQKYYPDSKSYPGEYRCIDGVWTVSIKKYDWDGIEWGYCPEDSQCLVNPDGDFNNNGMPETYFYSSDENDPSLLAPQCINNSQYILDHYCDNGNWTSRTKLLAYDLLGLVNNIPGVSEYTLFCEDYKKTLNAYKYSAYPFGIADHFLELDYGIRDRCLSKKYQPISCVNKICILKYSESGDEKAIFGTTINVPINATENEDVDPNLYLLGMFGKNQLAKPSYCQGAMDSDSNYDMCLGNDVWYNHETETLVYNKEGISSFLISSNPFIRFFRNLFDFIQFWKPELPFSPTVGIDLSFINKSKDFNRLYIDIKPTSSVRALRESIFVPGEGAVKFIAINYSGFSADICDTVNKFNDEWTGSPYYQYNYAIVCNRTGDSYYITTRDLTYFEARIDDIWQQLTSRLRVNS